MKENAASASAPAYVPRPAPMSVPRSAPAAKPEKQVAPAPAPAPVADTPAFSSNADSNTVQELEGILSSLSAFSCQNVQYSIYLIPYVLSID